MRNPCAEREDWFEANQLHFAAMEGNVDRCAELIRQGSDIHAYDKLGNTPLHYAAKGEHFETVKFLISHGANVNALCEPLIGETPLASVAQTCSLKMAELLLKSGADPTLRIGLRSNALEAAENRKRGDGPRVYELLCRYSARTKK